MERSIRHEHEFIVASRRWFLRHRDGPAEVSITFQCGRCGLSFKLDVLPGHPLYEPYPGGQKMVDAKDAKCPAWAMGDRGWPWSSHAFNDAAGVAMEALKRAWPLVSTDGVHVLTEAIVKALAGHGFVPPAAAVFAIERERDVAIETLATVSMERDGALAKLRTEHNTAVDALTAKHLAQAEVAALGREIEEFKTRAHEERMGLAHQVTSLMVERDNALVEVRSLKAAVKHLSTDALSVRLQDCERALAAQVEVTKVARSEADCATKNVSDLAALRDRMAEKLAVEMAANQGLREDVERVRADRDAIRAKVAAVRDLVGV